MWGTETVADGRQTRLTDGTLWLPVNNRGRGQTSPTQLSPGEIRTDGAEGGDGRTRSVVVSVLASKTLDNDDRGGEEEQKNRL